MRTRFRRLSIRWTTLLALATCALAGPLACTWASVTTVPYSDIRGGVRGQLRVLHGQKGDPELLGGTVVYLDGAGLRGHEPPLEMPALVFGTTGSIEPELLDGHLGQRVRLSFAGDVLHQPFTDAVDGDAHPFVSLADGTLTLPLESLGVVRVYCSLHGGERAVVFVSRTPYHDVVDSEGLYGIAGVPAGKYRLSIWSEAVKGPIRPIEVRRGSDAESTIWIDARKITR